MIVASVQEMLSDIPPNLAEDVVRGKIRLAGGGALLPGLAQPDRGRHRHPRARSSTTRCAASSGARPRFSSSGGGPSAAGLS